MTRQVFLAWKNDVSGLEGAKRTFKPFLEWGIRPYSSPLTSDGPRKPHILPSDANTTSPEHPIFFGFFLDDGAFDLVYIEKVKLVGSEGFALWGVL